MTAVFRPSRPLDHLVLPTGSLDVARLRLSALGFTVAPVGVHPFGTENACVYFSDGTFLEPLAIADRSKAQQAADEGNVFVARDRLFRFRNGDEGLSALVLGTGNAGADHVRFVGADLSAGDMLSFSRSFVDAAGKADIASFELAFAAMADYADAFCFSCERINTPKIDRAALQTHANGARRIVSVAAVSDAPGKFGSFVSKVAEAASRWVAGRHAEVALANATVTILDPGSFADLFGGPGGKGPRLAGIVFGVEKLARAEALFTANGIQYEKKRRSLVVPPALGQGAAFAFEEL
jgi:hypothetical protein